MSRAFVVDGEVRFESEWRFLAGFGLTLTGVLAEVVRTPDGFEFTVIMRLCTPGAATGPEVRAHGHVTGLPNDAAVRATVAGGGSFNAEIESPSLASGAVSFDVRGEVALEALSAVLPPSLRAVAASRDIGGTVDLTAKIARDTEGCWAITDLKFEAAKVQVGPARGRDD